MGPSLKKFCCCCTTRTGTLVIGTLGWLLTLIQIFGSASSIQSNSEYENQEYYNLNHNMYFKIGYGLVVLLVCVLLVVGVYKENKRYMLPWLVLKGFELAIIIIAAIVIFIFACIHAHGELFTIFFVMTLLGVLHGYFWMCVLSYYKDLKEPVANVVVYSSANIAPPQYTEKSENIV